MNKTAKSILLGSLSLSLLAGCSSDDDKKDSPSAPPAVEPKEIVIYGAEATGDFQMVVHQSDLSFTGIPTDKTLEFGNITTKPVKQVGVEPADTINVIVSDNQFGSVRMTRANGLEFDMSEAATKGTLQFDLKVNSTNKDAKASIMLVGHAEKAHVDITSALNAYTGGETQNVRVPLSCFENFDFSQTLTPFALNTEGNLDIELDNIRFVPESEGNRYELSCEENTNPVLNSNNSHNMFTRTGNPDVDEGFGGWARFYRTWDGGGTTLIETNVENRDNNNARHLKVTFVESMPSGRGGLLLNPNNRDMNWSEFVENGVIRFQMHVDYAYHPTHQMRVSFETKGHNSHVINLDPGCSNQRWGWVEVPVKELITRNDGAIDTTIIQNVRNALHLTAADVRGQETLQGITFRLAQVTLENQPGSEIKEGGYCEVSY